MTLSDSKNTFTRCTDNVVSFDRYTFERIIKFLCSASVFVHGIKSNSLFQFIILWNIPISNFLAGNKTHLSLENAT